MRRFDRARQIAALDPQTEYRQIYRMLFTYEFPWDLNESLSFALFRTYAVPSIGRLLERTGEFTERTQKRYDDTALILDTILEHGPDAGDGREALRRMNQMHRAYGISNDDLRYVLSTFVVVPTRWLDEFGWRRLTPAERMATVNHYRDVGAHMGIKDIPETYQGFESLLDDYERAHFGFDEGSLAVADATLDLMATFPPNHLLPKAAVRQFAYAVMDDPLLDAFGYPRPHPAVRAAARRGLKARAALLRLMPPRTTPKFVRDLPNIRSYPRGYDVRNLGTFPTPDAPFDPAPEPTGAPAQDDSAATG
jgi:hypothetical protein